MPNETNDTAVLSEAELLEIEGVLGITEEMKESILWAVEHGDVEPLSDLEFSELGQIING